MSGQSPSVLREELLQRIAAELDLSGELVATIIEPGASAGREAASRADGAGRPVEKAAVQFRPADRLAQVERGFLAVCAANRAASEPALKEMALDEWFSGELERRAAECLRDSADDPLGAVDPESDPELTALLAAILSRASTMDVSPGAFELEHAQLDLRRHDRLIERARRDDPGRATALATERGLIRKRLDKAADALEDEADRRTLG